MLTSILMRKILIVIIWTFTTSCQGQVEDIMQKGRVALANRNYREAIEYFDKVIKSDPNHENALLLRSKANYSLKNYQLVINDCEKILQINPDATTPDDLTAIWNLGAACNSSGQFEKARSYFGEALKYDSGNVRLYENIGYSYLEENNYEKALEQFQKMVSIDNRSDKGFYGIGKVYYLKGEFENSIKAFNRAIDINPEYAMAYQNRGSARLEINDQNGCCADWQKCLELGIVQIKPYIEEYCK